MNTFALWVENYLEYCRVEKGLSENSIAAYANDLNSLNKFAAEKSWDSGPHDYLELMEFLNALYSRRLSSNSVIRMTSTFRNFYRYLNENQVTQIDPTAQLESPADFENSQRCCPRIRSLACFRSLIRLLLPGSGTEQC